MTYTIEKTCHKQILNRDGIKNLNLSFTEGLCAASPANPSQPRNRQWYLENVIAPLVTAGKIKDKEIIDTVTGKVLQYDDRKLRYSGAKINTEQGNLEIAIGITHYAAFKEDLKRTDEENYALQQKGLTDFQDSYAFLSRPPGVAGLVITREGTVIIGVRDGGDCSGIIDSVAGHMQYKENITHINPVRDILRELEEERGLSARTILRQPIFIGIYSHPARGDLDLTYILHVDTPEEYFTTGNWKNFVKEREHKTLLVLQSFQEVQSFLETRILKDTTGRQKKYNVMYSTLGALQSLREDDLIRK